MVETCAAKKNIDSEALVHGRWIEDIIETQNVQGVFEFLHLAGNCSCPISLPENFSASGTYPTKPAYNSTMEWQLAPTPRSLCTRLVVTLHTSYLYVDDMVQ